MAHVQDRWFRTVRRPDGATVREQTARHGRGLRYRVRYFDPDGAERSKSFPDGRKRQADQFAAAVGADLLRGVFVDPDAGRVTLGRYVTATWLPAQTFGPSTRELVESRLRRHILPQLGGHRLGELARRPSVIQAWLRGLQPALAASHVKIVLGTLSAILSAAAADGLIVANPCRGRDVKPPKAATRLIVPWTAARVAGVRAGLPARYQALCDCGSGLGMRQGEVFGVAPGEDVDWLRRVVHVRRQVKIVGGRRVFAPPKGGKERDVPLPDAVALRLSAHLAAFPPQPVTLPWQAPGGRAVTVALMFTKPDGGAIWRNDFNKYAWHGALDAAGVAAARDTGFHQLRHYYASALLHDGVDIRTLAACLGHSDPGFTLRTYCHLLPSGADRARQAVDRALASGSGIVGPGWAQEGGNSK